MSKNNKNCKTKSTDNFIEKKQINPKTSIKTKIGSLFFHYRNYIFPFFYFILFIPSPKIFPSFTIPLILGLILLFIGLGIRYFTIGLVNINRAGKNKYIYADKLHTDGLFSLCRNPLYLGNIIEICGLAFLSNSLIFLLIMFPLFVFIYYCIVLAEEDFLLKKFGNEYLEYKQNVNRWIPNMKNISKIINSTQFNYKRVLIKEYTTTFIALLAATLLIMKMYYVFYLNNFIYSLPYFISIIFVLIFTYFAIRYLKKTKKITAKLFL